jgi:hypothetical protein
MIRRKIINDLRFYFCGATAVGLVLFRLYKGAENNFKQILGCAAISIGIYIILWALDRILGIISPLKIDLREATHIDRTNPYMIIIHGVEPITLCVNEYDIVTSVKVGNRTKKRNLSREFCFLKISNTRELAIDAEYAYMLVNILRAQRYKPLISGASYQAI